MNTTGNLKIEPQQARIFRNTQLFGQMDPFVELEFENKVMTSEICEKGGVIPFWHSEYIFHRSTGHLLFIRLFDHENLKKKHDLIGSVQIDISEYLKQNNTTTEWVNLFYDYQLAAQIKLKFTFQPLIFSQKSLLQIYPSQSVMISKKRNHEKYKKRHLIDLPAIDQDQDMYHKRHLSTKKSRRSYKRKQSKSSSILQQIIPNYFIIDTGKKHNQHSMKSHQNPNQSMKQSLQTTKTNQSVIMEQENDKEYDQMNDRIYSASEMDELLS